MKNKLILLLGMALILLSFFAFRGGEVLTGFAVKERVQVTPRFIEDPSYVFDDANEVTQLFTEKSLVKRGDEFTLLIDPGKNGVHTRGEIRDGDNEFIQYFYICGFSFVNKKICTSPRNLPLLVSRTAYDPRDNPHSAVVFDGSGKEVRLSFTVKQ